MPDESPPIDRKAELQTLLLTEYRKRPWLVLCGFVGIGAFVIGFILNSVLPGRVHVSTRYYIVTSLHLVGAVAGAIGLFASPQTIRGDQKLLRLVTILNAGFFILFGYRALVLLQLHSP